MCLRVLSIWFNAIYCSISYGAINHIYFLQTDVPSQTESDAHDVKQGRSETPVKPLSDPSETDTPQCGHTSTSNTVANSDDEASSEDEDSASDYVEPESNAVQQQLLCVLQLMSQNILHYTYT